MHENTSFLTRLLFLPDIEMHLLCQHSRMHDTHSIDNENDENDINFRKENHIFIQQTASPNVACSNDDRVEQKNSATPVVPGNETMRKSPFGDTCNELNK